MGDVDSLTCRAACCCCSWIAPRELEAACWPAAQVAALGGSSLAPSCQHLLQQAVAAQALIRRCNASEHANIRTVGCLTWDPSEESESNCVQAAREHHVAIDMMQLYASPA